MPEGEVLSLEWKQVDFLANVIRLGAGTTKNDEGRSVPFVLQLRTLLLESSSNARDASRAAPSFVSVWTGAASLLNLRVSGWRGRARAPGRSSARWSLPARRRNARIAGMGVRRRRRCTRA